MIKFLLTLDDFFQLDIKQKSSDQLKGDESDFQDLKNLYYGSNDRNRLNYDDTFWRNQIADLCRNVSLIWLQDQPAGETVSASDEENKKNEKCEGGMHISFKLITYKIFANKMLKSDLY